VLSLYLHKE